MSQMRRDLVKRSLRFVAEVQWHCTSVALGCPSPALWRMPQTKVLRDCQTTTGKEMHELSPEELGKLQRYSFLLARRTFEQELTEKAAKEVDDLSQDMHLKRLQRKANRDFLAKLDGQLRAGTGKGLVEYMPKARVASLKQGQTRYFISTGEGGEKRSCIVDETSGRRWYEVPKLTVASGSTR